MLTINDDIGSNLIVRSISSFNQVCVMFLIVYNKFRWITDVNENRCNGYNNHINKNTCMIKYDKKVKWGITIIHNKVQLKYDNEYTQNDEL